MTNELTNERKIYLDFTPATLDMTNYEELKKEVEKYAKRYEGLVFDRSEKSGANQARSELKALYDAIDNERKNVKGVYNKPLQEFEKQIKALTDLINKPLNDIRDGLKVIDEAEKEERAFALKTLLEAKLAEVELSIEELETDAKWLNKGNWTAKLNPTTKLESEIDNAIEQTLKEKQRKETEVKILTEFCKAQGIEPAGWTSQLEHRTAMEVIDLINLERERQKKLDEELAQKKKEHDEFIARQQQVIDEAEAFAEEQKKPQQTISGPAIIYSASLKIYGTEEQLNGLNEYIKANGLRVEEITESKDNIEEIHDDIDDWANGFNAEDFPF